MVLEQRWYAFDQSDLDHTRPSPGVYELFDEEGTTIYIGSAPNLLARLKKHLKEPNTTSIRMHTVAFCVGYAKDYKAQELLLRNLFYVVFGRDPLCNESD
jgi:hypothetical protein